jgi:hypothetical protein
MQHSKSKGNDDATQQNEKNAAQQNQIKSECSTEEAKAKTHATQENQRNTCNTGRAKNYTLASRP